MTDTQTHDISIYILMVYHIRDVCIWNMYMEYGDGDGVV